MWLINDEHGLTDPTLVGHKLPGRVLLARDGFPVPPLVCVPATVFDRVVRDTAIATAPTDIRSDADLMAAAEQARKQVRGVAVPAQLHRVLDDSFDEIAGEAGCVAVRACVVPSVGSGTPGENSAEDPFAGLSDGLLCVGRPQLALRLVDCWARPSTPRLCSTARGGGWIRSPHGSRWASSGW